MVISISLNFSLLLISHRMVCSLENLFFGINLRFLSFFFLFVSGDIREKLRLAFDMYDMNKNGKVIMIIFEF